MLSRVVSLAFIVVLLHTSIAAQALPQSTAQTLAKMQEVLHKAQDRDKAVKVTLREKIDNQRKFNGRVSEISDTSFTLNDQKTGKTMKFSYADVQQISQKGMSKGAKIAIGVVAGIVVGAIIVGYTITGGD